MAQDKFKRKLTTIFSADVAGYSRLMGEDEAATVKTLEQYKQIMSELIRQHRGRVVDSPGDNLLAEFTSVVDAVQCAVATQKELQARNADLIENRRMQFRIGVNLGDVIEEELGIQYVLEGNVQRSSDRIRVTAQLIDALKGHHLWAERYDRDLKDLFALQDEITLKILTSIQVKLTEGETYRTVPYAGGEQNLDCYLKAMEAMGHIQRANIEDNNVARRIAEGAISMCPEPQKPYSLMAAIHMMEYWFGSTKSPRESIEKAIELSRKSLAVDDSRAEGHALLGQLYCLKKEWEKAISEGERGVALNPSGADVKYWYAATLTYAGRPDKAILLFEKAIRLNPFGPSRYFLSYGHALRYAGQLEKVLMTGLFIRKTGVKFGLVLGKIFRDNKFRHRWPPFLRFEASISGTCDRCGHTSLKNIT